MSETDVIECSSRWNINVVQDIAHKTPIFSPISGANLSFYFSFSCQSKVFPKGIYYRFWLKLEKCKESKISESVLMIVNVSLLRTDPQGQLYKTYKPKVLMNISEMNFATIVDSMIRPDTYILKSDFKICYVSQTLTPNRLSKTSRWSDEGIKHFIGDFKSVYETGLLSDVEFIVDENTLPAHKIVLAAHSPVFAKMVTDDFKESSTNTITITDSSLEAFSTFLKSLYSGEISNESWPTVKELYVLADKYDVAFLRHECQDIIPSLLSMDTVCDILIVAFTYDDTDLKKPAVDFAVANINSLVASDEWRKLVDSHPRIGYEVTLNFLPTK